jgi:uncharacterized protein (TIGR02118 family)
MGLSFFLHFHGDAAQAGPFLTAAHSRLQWLKAGIGELCEVILHSPLQVSDDDPLPVAQDARMLLCQLYFRDGAALANGAVAAALSDCVAPLLTAKGVRDVNSHAMKTEWLRPGSPEDARAPARAVSFFVQYDGPAQDPEAFHSYYRTHHVPIVFRMPGIRSLSYYLPTQAAGPAVGRPVSRLQLVQAVFDTPDDFLKMRRSSERKEGLRDFDNYPKFEGPVTHQVMNSERIS